MKCIVCARDTRNMPLLFCKTSCANRQYVLFKLRPAKAGPLQLCFSGQQPSHAHQYFRVEQMQRPITFVNIFDAWPDSEPNVGGGCGTHLMTHSHPTTIHAVLCCRSTVQHQPAGATGAVSFRQWPGGTRGAGNGIRGARRTAAAGVANGDRAAGRDLSAGECMAPARLQRF